MVLYHSAKGTTWKNHKYIAIKNGRYIYPSKRQGAQSKMKRDKLISDVAKTSVKNRLNDKKRMGGSSKNSAISIVNEGIKNYSTPTTNEKPYISPEYLAEVAANSQKNVFYGAKTGQNLVRETMDKIERKEATKESIQKSMDAGTDAIERIIGSTFGKMDDVIVIKPDSGGKITIYPLNRR